MNRFTYLFSNLIEDKKEIIVSWFNFQWSLYFIYRYMYIVKLVIECYNRISRKHQLFRILIGNLCCIPSPLYLSRFCHLQLDSAYQLFLPHSPPYQSDLFCFEFQAGVLQNDESIGSASTIDLVLTSPYRMRYQVKLYNRINFR